MLHGSLAPDGAVGKITGKEGMVFEGPALVYDSEPEMKDGLGAGEITPAWLSLSGIRDRRAARACPRCLHLPPLWWGLVYLTLWRF